jgi:hypothetical protein
MLCGLLIVSLKNTDPTILCALTALQRYVSEIHHSCLMSTMPHLREIELILIFL